jgi:ABC-2 type transport system ATP-binding protein
MLDERAIAVDDIGLRRPTLDDVFLSLTGRATARVDGPPEPAADAA